MKDLPYPYTSKAQFERSMDTPIGTEWNTRVGFQRWTLPKVTKKVRCILLSLREYSITPGLMSIVHSRIDGCRYFAFGEASVASRMDSIIISVPCYCYHVSYSIGEIGSN